MWISFLDVATFLLPCVAELQALDAPFFRQALATSIAATLCTGLLDIERIPTWSGVHEESSNRRKRAREKT